MTNQPFFYDGQIRRFLTQFIRLVSGFQVEFGRDRKGNITLQRVPVIYGDPSRQAATVMKNNSENMLSAVPMMAAYISGMRFDQDRIQDPYHVSKLNLRQKSYDPATGEYGTTQDSAYTVERMMPVPYTMTLKLDAWTSNNLQQHQLFEQLAVLFNPSLEIQSTDNYIDWTSLTTVRQTGFEWTNRSVPAGNDDTQLQIMTWTFEIPIWLTRPAKVKQLGVIQRIITSVFDETGTLSQDAMLEGNLMARKHLTPLGYNLLYSGNTLQLLKKSELVNEEGDGKIGTPDMWTSLIDVYGSLKPGISQARLQIYTAYDEVNGETDYVEVVGTIANHPSDDSQLLFTPDIDTLPANTLPPVAAIIDPTAVKVDAALLSPNEGTRYLILENIGAGSVVWGDLVAEENDIIEFINGAWRVALNSNTHDAVEYVTNLKTSVQYQWINKQWVKSVMGLYREGEWSIIL